MHTTSHLPKDLMSLLEDNFKAGRPLLEDAMLYRGTRRPDQTSSSYSAESMHGSLLPQVAASYTHNYEQKSDKDITFIGTYKVDRETTRFYQDFGLEQHLEGKKMPSMSVKEAEKFLEPFVREFATASDNKTRSHAEDRLEMAIKRNLYEAAVPTRTADRESNRPVDLYVYHGRPDVAVRQAVGLQMSKVGPHNEAAVKDFMVKNHRNAAIKSIHMLSTQVGPAQKALGVLKDIAQREFSGRLHAEHGHKSLNQLMNDVAKQPLSADQERIGRFAKALVEGVEHPNPAVRAKANAVAYDLTTLDKGTATFKDVAKVAAIANAVYGKPEASAAKPTPTATAARTPANMDR
jgi:hypothetical protein